MQAFLEYAVKGLVNNPEEVQVTPVDRHGLTIYELRLDPSDIGKVVGKEGRMIQVVRSLLQAGGARKGIRCAVEIVEERPAH